MIVTHKGTEQLLDSWDWKKLREPQAGAVAGCHIAVCAAEAFTLDATALGVQERAAPDTQ